MTVAHPVLSACGHEVCILPTALLSTHTGGFGKPVVVHFDDALDAIWKHWRENGIRFDAILVGYLGSIPAIHTTERIIRELLQSDGVVIIDPVMGDHGKLYAGFDSAYVDAMKTLCEAADVLIPNLTEAVFLTGEVRRQEDDCAYGARLLDVLSAPNVILTGLEREDGDIGILIREEGKRYLHTHRRIGGSFHGTGDLFAATFAGVLLQGRDFSEAVETAAAFTGQCIQLTVDKPAHWYGLRFESMLPELMEIIHKQNRS